MKRRQFLNDIIGTAISAFVPISMLPAVDQIQGMRQQLTASEALYGFCGWLTTRKEKTIMSSSNDVSIIADLIYIFCRENGLSEPREGWEKHLVHPESFIDYFDDRRTQE